MGSYLSSIQPGQNLQTNCPLVNLSLAKIRELHGGFKSVCDSFAINLTDFENIFQSGQATFLIFDTDKNGFIDAHEILAGLVMFSDSKAEEKIRFLFDLFEHRIISYEEALRNADSQNEVRLRIKLESKRAAQNLLEDEVVKRMQMQADDDAGQIIRR